MDGLCRSDFFFFCDYKVYSFSADRNKNAYLGMVFLRDAYLGVFLGIGLIFLPGRPKV